MATNAVIGALRVVLGADTATFEVGLKKAESSLSSFSKKVTTIAAGIGLERAFSSIVSGITSGMKSVFNEADNIGKAAQRIGLTVEELSKLKYAADISDVSFETLEKSAMKLSRSMADAVADKTGKAALQFRALGIDVRNADGSFKSVSTVMAEMGDRFSGMSDGATKVAASMALMGKQGTQMIPMLNAGSKGIKDLMKEAEDLGAVITTRVANSADRMSDDFKRLTTANKALSNSIIQELAPYMGVLTDRFIEWLKEGRKVSDIGVTIVNVFLRIGEAALVLGAHFSNAAEELGALKRVALATSWDDMKKAWGDFTTAGERLQARIFEIKGSFALLRFEAGKVRDQLGETTARHRDHGKELAVGKNAIDEFIKSQQKALATQQAEAMTVGMAAGARERLKVVMQAETVAREANIVMTEAQRVKVTELANAMQMANLQQEGFNLVLSTAEPHEKFRMEMEKNQAALAAIGATSAQVAQVNTATAEKFGATWYQVTGQAASGFAAFANEMGKSNSKIATVGKALGIVEATINTYVAFTKALASVPPPLNYVAAAGVLAAGMAKVMAIKSQSIPKMATGGTLTPKAFGGQDSVLMQARVRPDEQIEVRRPGEGARNSMPDTITLNFPDSLSREFWAKGIEQINRLTSDGYRLKVA